MLFAMILFSTGLMVVLWRRYGSQCLEMIEDELEYRDQGPPSRRATKFKDPVICRRILACTGTDNEELRNIIRPVRSRAFPNKRLARAFGIDNAFTTTNDNYRKIFRKAAAEKIARLDDGKWEEIAGSAKGLVLQAVEQERSNPLGIRLVEFVQILSFKMSLHVLYQMDPLLLENSKVSGIAYNINELWMESKESDNSKVVKETRRKLKKALSEILPGARFRPKETPLNIILPAYETLWRVVLRCFLEVTFRSTEIQAWCEILQRFLANPTAKQFGECTLGPDAVSVSFIVSEALRLYPPTSRVYRKFCMPGHEKPEIVAADIEGCQRDEATWGNHSYVFKPSRWATMSEETRRAFMPFGGEPFICPAKKDFGPRMIGVLVAALATYISSDGWDIQEIGPETGHCHDDPQDTSKPLESGRRAHDAVEIFRRPV